MFWTGFLVRPFGAILFGHLGDLIGRKFTFMLTLGLMGAPTFVVGLLPGYATIGALAPILLVTMRVLQGLALGGEYGGAATYIAEHAPDGKRGFYTWWIQTTATMGIVLALLVILVCRLALGDQAFGDWGWRVPFLISAILVLLSVISGSSSRNRRSTPASRSRANRPATRPPKAFCAAARTGA